MTLECPQCGETFEEPELTASNHYGHNCKKCGAFLQWDKGSVGDQGWVTSDSPEHRADSGFKAHRVFEPGVSLSSPDRRICFTASANCWRPSRSPNQNQQPNRSSSHYKAKSAEYSCPSVYSTDI